MAKGYLYFRAGATTAERDALLAKTAYVIHHSANQINFDKAPPATWQPQGQAFNEEMELRWQPGADGHWELLLITEGERPELKERGWQETPMEVDNAQSIILWGQHWTSLEGADKEAENLQEWGWVQAQIEADLHYPVEGSKQQSSVALTTKTYRKEGIARLTRLVKIQPAKSKG